MALSKKEVLILFLIFAVFIGLHVAGIHAPYHQDEYKWVLYSHPEIIPPGTVPHPPLTEFIYTRIGPIVGDNNFRVIPFAFGIADFFLIFYLAKIIFDKRAALWTVFLFTISFYSLLATLMVDVDGAVMPMFMLLLFIGYYKFKYSEWKNKKWITLILVGAVGGFLVKVSGGMPIAALVLDLAIEIKVFSDIKKLFRYVTYVLIAAVVSFAIIFVSKFVFPFFNVGNAFSYALHFWNSSSFLGRNWFQTFIQFAKALLYTSPLLAVPAFFVDKEIWQKTRAFLFFIGLGLFFYLIVFDFSGGALDRYFQFMVVPLCIVSGVIFSRSSWKGAFSKIYTWLVIAVSVVIFTLQFLRQAVPPLYPKTEWLHRVLSLKWNFLFPFMGGSGPLPFYISFAFMALMWLAPFILLVVWLKNKKLAANVLLGVLVIGITYNTVFVEEYLFGKINGSAPTLVKDATAFIANNSNIKKVTVYNDNGGFNVQETGKYDKRLYIDPNFDIREKIATLNQNKEHYLVVDIPHIDPATVYARYFASCGVVWQEKSGVIAVTIYDCRKAPDIKQ